MKKLFPLAIASLLVVVLWAGAGFLARQAATFRTPYVPLQTQTGNQETPSYPFSTFLPQFFKQDTPAPTPIEPQIDANAAGIFNMTSGTELWSQNPDQPEGIASLTKLMTAVIAKQNASSSALITIVPEDLAVDSVNKDLAVGDEFTLDEAMHFLMISSDNAIAHAVARTIFKGGISDFVSRMNALARSLGMTHTQYVDPIGLGADVSSVSDLALFARYVQTREPELFSFSRYAHLTMVTAQGRTFTLNNTNTILNQIPGFVGSKTGWTPETGGSLLVVFRTAKGEFASIVLGSDDRFGDTSAILAWYSRTMSDTIRQ